MDSFPRPGDLSTLGPRASAFVGTVDSEFLSRARGAPDALIDRYAQVLGYNHGAFPLDLRSYFKCFGLDDGGLLTAFAMQVRIDRIVEMYADDVHELDRMSAALPVVATYIIGDQVSVDRNVGGTSPVVGSSCGERIELLAESLEHFVFKAAFLFREQQRWSGQYLSASANGARSAAGAAPDAGFWVRSRVQEFFEGRGATVKWPTDDRELLMGGDGFSVCLTTDSIGGFQLQVFQPLQRPDIELERFTFGIGVSSRQVFAAGRRKNT